MAGATFYYTGSLKRQTADYGLRATEYRRTADSIHLYFNIKTITTTNRNKMILRTLTKGQKGTK